MLRYYPSFRVKTNLIAGENLFNTSDGAKYTGSYYETYDGRFFSGPNPIIGPNQELKRVVTVNNVPGLTGILQTQTTTGNEFLLDGVPYVGPYFQDFAGNYYTVPVTSPSSITSPTNNIGSNTYPTDSTIITPPIQDTRQGTSTQDVVVPGDSLRLSTLSQTNTSPNQTGIQNTSQILAGINPNIAIINSGKASPMNEVIVDSEGNKFVRGPQNQLIPYEQAQKSLQDSLQQPERPRLLQPIADKVPPPGTSRGGGKRTSPVNLQQQFIFNTKLNPDFTGQPTSFYPNPTQEDYDRGYITRYFVKKVNQNGYIIEISIQEFNAINEGTVTYDVSNYQTKSTFWKISGNLTTKRLSQYDIREGIIETNKRLIENIEKTFVGIKAFIGGQYDKFTRPTE